MNGFISRFNEYLSGNAKLVKGSVNDMDNKVARYVSGKISEENICESFFVFNVYDVIHKHKQWTEKLPRIRPYYSVKANNSQILLSCLAKLGVGFDCVTDTELKQVLSLNVSPKQDIIYANPIKPIHHLDFARQMSVDIMTFDNEDELLKIADHYPSAQLVIRLRVEDSESIQPFQDKYGCLVSEVRSLLSRAKCLNLNVIGVSFHVGCRCSNARAFTDALVEAKKIFQQAKSLYDYEFRILNIGGGFPGANWHSGQDDYFSSIASAINTSLDKYFPLELYPNLSIIAEPGTYYCASAFYLAAQVIGKRIDNESNNKHIQYYINDGVFGSFFGPLWGYPIGQKSLPMKQLIDETELSSRSLYPSTIWGQTLASLDVVVKDISIPELNTEEWLLFKDMGDYSVSLTTEFCGFKPAQIYCYEDDCDNC